MLVYVLNPSGKPLMPCTAVKARILLKQGKAKAVRKEPFTIQLLYGSSGYKQDITLGIDAGAKHIGLSASTIGFWNVFYSEITIHASIAEGGAEIKFLMFTT